MNLQEVITAALAAGCGVLIMWAWEQIAQAMKESGNEPSPKTKRRVVFGLCVVVPSILYGVLSLIVARYSWAEHLTAVVMAFSTSTVLHGELRLPTGEQVKAKEQAEAVLKARAAVSGGPLVKLNSRTGQLDEWDEQLQKWIAT